MLFQYLKKRAAVLLAFIILFSASFSSLPSIRAEELSANLITAGEAAAEDSVSMDNDTVSGEESPSGNNLSDNSPSGNSPSGNSPSGNSPSGNSLSDNSTSGNEISENKTGREKEDWEIASIDGVTVGSLSADFTKPCAFLTKKKLVLNGMRRSVSDDTYVVFNVDGDYELSGLTGAGFEISVNKLSYNGLPAYRISVSTNSSSAKGSTKISIIPRNRMNGKELNKLKLIISVKKKNPPVKWAKQTVTLSNSVKGEFALNTPNIDGVSIVPLSGNERYKPKVPACLNIRLQNENTVKITAGKGVKLNKSYPVTLWLMYTDSTQIKAVKRKFNVKVTDKAKSVKLKKLKGSALNLSDRNGTALHYRPLTKNTGFVVNDVSFREGSLSENYTIKKTYAPDTREITDFYVCAKNGAVLHRGKDSFGFKMLLQAPGMDAGSMEQTATVSAKKKSTKIKTTFVSGNALKVNETLSDNHVAGTIELRVISPKYAAIDWASIKDLTNNAAFRAEWTIDRWGQTARIRIVIDKSKVISGKKYTLAYTLKARGADAETAPTKIVVKYKA